MFLKVHCASEPPGAPVKLQIPTPIGNLGVRPEVLISKLPGDANAAGPHTLSSEGVEQWF